MSSAWWGFDLDGTLAMYEGWVAPDHIGEPIPLMVERVKALLQHGKTVKIFTGRVSKPSEEAVARAAIEAWCKEHIGEVLQVTCCKDYRMVMLYDDRCVQVIPNTGQIVTAP